MAVERRQRTVIGICWREIGTFMMFLLQRLPNLSFFLKLVDSGVLLAVRAIVGVGIVFRGSGRLRALAFASEHHDHVSREHSTLSAFPRQDGVYCKSII